MEEYRPAKNSLSNFELWRYSRETYYATLNPILYGQDSELWFEGVIVARIYKHSFTRLRTQIRAKGWPLARFHVKFVVLDRGKEEEQSDVTRGGVDRSSLPDGKHV